MNKIIILLLLLASTQYAHAQNKKKNTKEEKIPVYNYTIDDPMDAVTPAPAPQRAINTLFPEFYSYNSVKVKDTTYTFLCYDRRDSLINVDTLHDVAVIRYVSVFKSYNDREHTYDDNKGVKHPLPISSITRRYDKAGNDHWISIDYATKKYANLKENLNEIVRTETITRTNPSKGVSETVTIRYYKAAP